MLVLITHTFLNIVPAVYLGVSDADTTLAVLPGHRMLLEFAIDGKHARSIHKARCSSGDACSMCGELCAIEVMKRALEGRE